MPMWKYLAGDFSSPLSQSLGVEPTRIGTPKPDEPPSQAKEQVESFQRELSRLSGARVVWSDQGFAEVSVQFTTPSFLALQEFAAFQDAPVGAAYSASRENRVLHKSLLRVQHGAPTRFPHLIFHELNQGFYVPCNLPQPVPFPEISPAEQTRQRERGLFAKIRRLWQRFFPPPDPIAEARERWAEKGLGTMMAKLEIEVREEARREAEQFQRDLKELGLEGTQPLRSDRVGSSEALLRELESLRPILGMTQDWGELSSGPAAPADDPLCSVKYAWSVLHFAARISAEKQLPVILDG
jgi:hypothetical protein